jgi:hypothetical protein
LANQLAHCIRDADEIKNPNLTAFAAHPGVAARVTWSDHAPLDDAPRSNAIWDILSLLRPWKSVGLRGIEAQEWESCANFSQMIYQDRRMPEKPAMAKNGAMRTASY